MRLSSVLVTVLTVMVAAMVVMTLTRCSESPQPVDRVAPIVSAEPEPIPVEATEEVVTQEDVRAEILDHLDGLTKRGRAQTIDVSVTLFRMAELYNVDPIMLTDEYLDLLDTTTEMQPVFTKGWDGGMPRAMLVTLDIFRGTYEVRDRTCHEVDPDRFDEGMDEHDVERVNPYVLLAIGYRESRLAKRTEIGLKLGGGNERGMFQFRPTKDGRKGFIEARFMPRYKGQSKTPENRCSPFDRMCATRGAANALAWIRCDCIRRYGESCSIDTYVAGYGMNRIPSPDEARHSRGPRNARRFLCAVRDDCDELWPVDHSDDFALSL